MVKISTQIKDELKAKVEELQKVVLLNPAVIQVGVDPPPPYVGKGKSL